MGGGGKKKSKKKKSKVQQAAAKRHANFKKTLAKTGKRVQTHGGTKKNYTKSEARALEKAHGGAAGFSRVTGGAANPLNRAPSTEGIKVGEVKPEFASPLTGTDYSQFAAPNINYNYSERPKSDISFSDAVRGGARFNEAGRNDLTGGNLLANDYTSGEPTPQMQRDAARDILNSGMKLNEKQKNDLLRQANMPLKLAQGRINPFNIFQTQDAIKEGEAAREGVRPQVDNPGFLDGLLNRNSETQKMINDLSSTGINNLVASNNLSGLGISTAGGSEAGFDRDSFNRAMEGNYDPDSSGGLNIGSSAFGLDSETSSRIGRALAAGPSPRMLSEGGDLRFSDMYNADTPGATLTQGINAVKNRIPLLNRLPDMKINSVAEEAQRQYLGYNPNLPASALARMDKRGGGTRAAAAPTVAQQVSPETQPVQTASTTPTTQTGVDPNRLLQIQQQAYQQAYNPMSIGGFNPQFRFASRAPRIDYSTYFNYS